MRSARYRPGQALAIAGPAGCGKSLFQALITEILGGRSAKPYRYMSGATDFNSDLFGAEHLVIEDEVASTDLRKRLGFGAQIKNVTVNATQSCHAKCRPALTLTPCWRLSISVNDEPENLLIFPPLDESIADKLILPKADKQPMPMPTETPEQHAAFWATLLGELPAFLHFLSAWEIPHALRSPRFGIVHYHNPLLLAAINQLAPEEQLLQLIDTYVVADCDWEGTAGGLADLLFAATSSYDAALAKRLLNWSTAAGTYLGRLASRYPERVEQCRSAQKRLWCIKTARRDGLV
jgi:hypothetical protein